MLLTHLTRALVLAGIAFVSALGYLALRTHYLPNGQGFRFPATKLLYPAYTPSALAPVWSQSSYAECFFARADGLGVMQFEVYPFAQHPPHRIQWTLEDLDNPGGPAVVRSGSFSAGDMQAYGFIRLRFDPIRRSAARLYKFTLTAPDTSYREAGAVTLFRSADGEAIMAGRSCGTAPPAFSMLFDKARPKPVDVVFRGSTVVSQQITAHQEFMTSLQIQAVVAGAPRGYKLHWSVIRAADQTLVGSGDIPASNLDNLQFVDLFLRERERCYGRTYKLTLTAPAETPESGPDLTGVTVTPVAASTVTIDSAGGTDSRNGYSMRIIIMDSVAMRGLRLWDQTRDDIAPRDESFSSKTTLWYFPAVPASRAK